MMRTLGCLTAVILVVLTGLSTVNAQVDQWSIQTSPDKIFSISTPIPLVKAPYFEAELGVWENKDDLLDTQYFVSQQQGKWTNRFAVIVIGPRAKQFFEKATQRRNKTGDFLLESLASVFLADDDEMQFLTGPKKVKVGGVEGVEYRYQNDDEINKGLGKLYTKGVFVDRSNRLFILVFVGDDHKDLDSHAAERFINSFRTFK